MKDLGLFRAFESHKLAPMLILLSPSKDLNFDPLARDVSATTPQLETRTAKLAEMMKTKSASDLKKLMGISDKLADLNAERYKTFQASGKSNSAKPALFAFTGDVYRAMQPNDFSDAQLKFAQGTVRTLSGLYGVLRPFDLIQPYRLEMGTRLKTKHGGNLYEFWGDEVTETLNKDLKDQKESKVINLASAEYFKVINPKKLDAPILDIKFLEEKEGKASVIGLFAKRARGVMTKWIIENKIEIANDLSDFNENGYKFVKGKSSDTELVFSRKQP